MSARWKSLLVVALCFAATTASAQTKWPTETHNAALRYWLAFADLQDPPADKATTELLEKTAAGEVAWDEAKLGAILDQNEAAILRMQRATQLPDCDWGLEYDLGPSASIAYVPRARVLARLNTLYGMRLAAKGEAQKAVDTWLAGIRFSQHLAKGGTLIFSLVAKMALLSNFQAITGAAQSGQLDSVQREQFRAVLRALPEMGLNWGEALRYEEASLEVAAHQLAEAENPSAYYQSLMGEPTPKDFSVPSSTDVATLHKLMSAAEEALRLPPERAKERLQNLQDSVETLHPFFQQTTPSFTKINDARAQVQAARQKLLQAIS